jgi:L-lactate dehydrogenase
MPTRVAVIGAGHVGAATVNALVLLGVADHVVLYDRDLGRAEGQAWDTADGTPLVDGAEIVATDDWRALHGSDVAVVAIGAPPQPGRSRLDERNGGAIREVVARLDEAAPDAVVVIVTNPVDVMTRVAQETSVRSWRMIFGTGTVLDTARLRLELATRLGVDAQNAHVHVIGEHGDSSFPAWSSATIGPVPLSSFPLPSTQRLAGLESELADAARRRGTEVLARKGHTASGIAVAVSRIVECVLRDQRRILTVSSRASSCYGVGESLVLSLPCIVGRAGVVSRLPLALDARERQMLERSAAILEVAYRDQI